MGTPDSQAALLQNLRFLMEARCISSVSELARRAGAAQTTFNTIFLGEKEPGLSTLDKLATGFDVPAWLLLLEPAVVKAVMTQEPDQLADLITALRSMSDQAQEALALALNQKSP